MLFAKETYVRFKNEGVALCKIGGIILLAGDEKDIPFGNISTMSVSNGYRNGLKLIGLVVDGELTRICQGSCKLPAAEGFVPAAVSPEVVEVPEEVVAQAAPEVVAEEEKVEVVEAPVKRGRKPKA